jgi:hypothetical protein
MSWYWYFKFGARVTTISTIRASLPDTPHITTTKPAICGTPQSCQHHPPKPEAEHHLFCFALAKLKTQICFAGKT